MAQQPVQQPVLDLSHPKFSQQLCIDTNSKDELVFIIPGGEYPPPPIVVKLLPNRLKRHTILTQAQGRQLVLRSKYIAYIHKQVQAAVAAVIRSPNAQTPSPAASLLRAQRFGVVFLQEVIDFVIIPPPGCTLTAEMMQCAAERLVGHPHILSDSDSDKRMERAHELVAVMKTYGFSVPEKWGVRETNLGCCQVYSVAAVVLPENVIANFKSDVRACSEEAVQHLSWSQRMTHDPDQLIWWELLELKATLNPDRHAVIPKLWARRHWQLQIIEV